MLVIWSESSESKTHPGDVIHRHVLPLGFCDFAEIFVT